MLLLTEATQTELGASVRESAVAVYRNIAPVSTPVHGTTLPVAVPTFAGTSVVGSTTALGTVNTIDSTDMGTKVLLGRGRAFAGLGWQPVSGSEKRNGTTRGRPPREPRMG